MTCKFQPGDRIVNTSFASPHEGIGGTVVHVKWIHKRMLPTGASKGHWQFVVILDTAERRVITNTHSWEHEQDFIDGSYIPF